MAFTLVMFQSAWIRKLLTFPTVCLLRVDHYMLVIGRGGEWRISHPTHPNKMIHPLQMINILSYKQHNKKSINVWNFVVKKCLLALLPPYLIRFSVKYLYLHQSFPTTRCFCWGSGRNRNVLLSSRCKILFSMFFGNWFPLPFIQKRGKHTKWLFLLFQNYNYAYHNFTAW